MKRTRNKTAAVEEAEDKPKKKLLGEGYRNHREAPVAPRACPSISPLDEIYTLRKFGIEYGDTVYRKGWNAVRMLIYTGVAEENGDVCLREPGKEEEGAPIRVNFWEFIFRFEKAES